MTKWVLSGAAKAYALPILLLSLFKDYPFLIYHPGPILAGKLSGNGNDGATSHVFPTCFLHFGGKPSGNGNDGATSHMFPTCFPHFGGKPRTGNGNEGAPDAL